MSDQGTSGESNHRPGHSGEPYPADDARPAGSWADEATMAMPIAELLADDDPDDPDHTGDSRD